MPSSGHFQTVFAFYFESKTFMLISVSFLVSLKMNPVFVIQKLNINRPSSFFIIVGLPDSISHQEIYKSIHSNLDKIATKYFQQTYFLTPKH